jgi:hypothetical protein
MRSFFHPSPQSANLPRDTELRSRSLKCSQHESARTNPIQIVESRSGSLLLGDKAIYCSIQSRQVPRSNERGGSITYLETLSCAREVVKNSLHESARTNWATRSSSYDLRARREAVRSRRTSRWNEWASSIATMIANALRRESHECLDRDDDHIWSSDGCMSHWLDHDDDQGARRSCQRTITKIDARRLVRSHQSIEAMFAPANYNNN